MSRSIRRAIGLALAGSSLSLAPVGAHAITRLAGISDQATDGYVTSHSNQVDPYVWGTPNSSRDGTPTVFNAAPNFLGWAHTSRWYDLRITHKGNYRISVVRTAEPAGKTLNPAFTLWPVTPDKPFDFHNCIGSCGDAPGSGTHAYNQVAAPSPINSSAWMLGEAGPDVNPLGEELRYSLKWVPQPGKAAVTGFIGYANSGSGGWKAGMPLNLEGGRLGINPDFSFGTDQVEVLQGGWINTAPGGGLAGSTLSETSSACAPRGGGSAALNLFDLAAGHYLIAVGGSCVESNCGAGVIGYRISVNEITGEPQAFARANGASAPKVRAGARVTLDGSASLGADGNSSTEVGGCSKLTYEWQQTAGPAVTLDPGPGASKPSFATPLTAGGTVLKFALTVRQNELTSPPSEVTVTVTDENQPPSFNLPAKSILEGGSVTLAPANLNDPDGDRIASYRWEHIGGPAVALSNPTNRELRFTAPLVGTAAEPLQLIFKLTVTDDFAPNPASKTVTVPVSVSRDPGRLDCSRASASPAKIWPPNRLLKPVGISGIYVPGNGSYELSIDSITQTEPVQDKAAKDRTGPDGKIKRGKITKKTPLKLDTALLRAERNPKGDGRLYRIGFTAHTVETDQSRQTCSGSVIVEVPVAPDGSALDKGTPFDSTRRR